MYKKIILTITLFGFFAQIALPQDIKKANQTSGAVNRSDISPELKEKAVKFLRETAVEVNNFRTLENRISFSAEMAGLMWFSDEEEAREMFQNVFLNFRQLLAQYDSQMNAFGATNPEEVYSQQGSALQKTFRKFAKAMAVRQQITQSLAEHDPRLALEFFTETAQSVSNPLLRKQMEQNDTYFETQLIGEVAAQDVDTALKYARKKLAKGVGYEMIELLKNIYEKDADKGIAFGEDIISKIKSEELKIENVYLYSSMLSLGEESSNKAKDKKDKRPVFSDQSMREIVDLFARVLLTAEDEDFVRGYVAEIEKYAPARAAQIRTKFEIKKPKVKNMPAADIIDKDVEIAKDENVKPGDDEIENLLEGVQNHGNKKFSDEEKQKITGEMRRIVASPAERGEKIDALGSIAALVASAGDRELALDVLKEAERLINLQPTNYRDYMETWMLIAAYSNVDPERVFPMLDNTIYRLNDTISAFVKVGEFIDVEGEMVEDGEIQVGSFGGGITRDMLKELKQADSVILNLAKADFEKTRTMTNRFDRPEVRILAKMLILRSILGKDKKVKSEEKEEAVK